MKRAAFLLAMFALGSCADFPKDQRGTLDRIRDEGVVRAGMIASGGSSAHRDRLRDWVERSARSAGGRPLVLEESTEALLLMLEAGELDLVVGQVDRSSPWSSRVHLLPPLARETRGESELETTGAARNGENGWITLLEREGRALSEVQ